MNKNKIIPVLVISIIVLAIVVFYFAASKVSVNDNKDTYEGESYMAALEELDAQKIEAAIRNGGNIILPETPTSENPSGENPSGENPSGENPSEEPTNEDDIPGGVQGEGRIYYVPYYVDRQKADEMADAFADGSISIKEVFGESLFVGDSVITGFHDYYNFQYDVNVVASVGAAMHKHLSENLDKIISLNPEYLIIRYGLNEIDLRDGLLETFITNYRNNLTVLKEKLPYTKIIVLGLTPVTDAAIQKAERLGRVSVYNERIYELCRELKVGYYENTPLFTENFDRYAKDGIHFSKALYDLWMIDFIREMGIY